MPYSLRALSRPLAALALVAAPSALATPALASPGQTRAELARLLHASGKPSLTGVHREPAAHEAGRCAYQLPARFAAEQLADASSGRAVASEYQFDSVAKARAAFSTLTGLARCEARQNHDHVAYSAIAGFAGRPGRQARLYQTEPNSSLATSFTWEQVGTTLTVVTLYHYQGPLAQPWRDESRDEALRLATIAAQSGYHAETARA